MTAPTTDDRRPTILLDIDGVTLDWFKPLPAFIESKGLGDAEALQRFHAGMGAGMVHLDELFGPGTLTAYHTSPFGCSMPAMETPGTANALAAMKPAHRVIAVTAFSDQPEVIAQRVVNLNTLFPGVFDEVHSVAAFSSKRAKLEEINTTNNVVLYVDDNRFHVEEGIAVFGADKVMWFNGDAQQTEVRVAKNWAVVSARVEQLWITRDLPPMPPMRKPRVF